MCTADCTELAQLADNLSRNGSGEQWGNGVPDLSELLPEVSLKMERIREALEAGGFTDRDRPCLPGVGMIVRVGVLGQVRCHGP